MFGRKGLAKSPTTASVSADPSPLVAEMQSIASRASECHPLVTAARLVALMSPNSISDHAVDYIQIVDIDQPLILDLPQGMQNDVGLSFSYVGTKGETGLVFLTTSFGRLQTKHGEARDTLAADLICKVVKDYKEVVRAVAHKIGPQMPPDQHAQADRIRNSLRGFLG